MQLRTLSLPLLALSLGATPCNPTPPPDAGPPDGTPPDGTPPSPDAPAGDDVAGCDGAVLRRSPIDPAARGPHPVGARTVAVGDLTAEVWYPAVPGSDSGPALRYDLRVHLPPTERGKIPDDDNPWQTCDCRRDLPLDTAHGPYPVIVFVHGTASFRHQSLSQVIHWASRGFVAIAADHPGLMLGHVLATVCPGNPRGTQNLSRDIDALLAALAAPGGDLAFLAGHVDAARAAVIGHSAGASAAAGATGKPGVRVVGALAGNRVAADAPALAHVLFMGGLSDAVVRWSDVTRAYSTSATPRALIGLGNAGHLAFSDLCDTRNTEGQNLLSIATEHEICGAAFAGLLFDCNDEYLEGPLAAAIIDDATSSVLEPALQCRADLARLDEIRSRHADITEFRSDP